MPRGAQDGTDTTDASGKSKTSLLCPGRVGDCQGKAGNLSGSLRQTPGMYSVAEPIVWPGTQIPHVKNMWNIALLALVNYNLLVTVQPVKSDSYICVDKLPIWNRSENRYFELNCMSCTAFDLFTCTMAQWLTAAITGKMSCYMWHEWYKTIFPCWHGSSAQTWRAHLVRHPYFSSFLYSLLLVASIKRSAPVQTWIF